MKIPDEDLKVSAYPERDYSKGGQHVGVTDTGVKIEHIPTGTIAIVETERSQHRNRAIALSMIEYGLLEMGIKYEL